MRISPLHTAEFIGNQIIGSGSYDPTRMTGRSTALALRYLSLAIENPGEVIQVMDHTGKPRCHDDLARRCLEMASALGLKHIRYSQQAGDRGRRNRIVFG